MTIAEFPIAAVPGHDLSWVARHGFAMTLTGCLTFWVFVATSLYIAL
jgi:hypothetical protein